MLRTNSASNAKKKMLMSPMGEAFMRLPAKVAILRMGVEEMSLMYLSRSGNECRINSDSTNSLAVMDAPICI